MHVERTIAEPTAVALGAFQRHKGKPERTAMVCSWGGGSFQATLVRYAARQCQVLGAEGNVGLCGFELDKRVLELLLRKLPEGVGQRLPKGADIVMQVHYHRTGKEERDRTKLGVYFQKGPVTGHFQAMPVPGLFLRIPAGEKAVKVNTSVTLSEDVTLHYLSSELYRGSDDQPVLTVTYAAELPTGVEPRLADPDELVAVGWWTMPELLAADNCSPWLPPLVAAAEFSLRTPGGGYGLANWLAVVRDPVLVASLATSLRIAVLTAVFLGNGGQIAPDGYDGAIGPALLTGAAAVAVAVVAALFAPGRVRQ